MNLNSDKNFSPLPNDCRSTSKPQALCSFMWIILVWSYLGFELKKKNNYLIPCQSITSPSFHINFFSFQRLIVCLEESLYIHNIRDMKVLHTIRDTPPNPAGLCALSTDSDNCFLAYPGSSTIGEVQIFDTVNLVSNDWWLY